MVDAASVAEDLEEAGATAVVTAADMAVIMAGFVADIMAATAMDMDMALDSD